jgi:hypothetical protein
MPENAETIRWHNFPRNFPPPEAQTLPMCAPKVHIVAEFVPRGLHFVGNIASVFLLHVPAFGKTPF